MAGPTGRPPARPDRPARKSPKTSIWRFYPTEKKYLKTIFVSTHASHIPGFGGAGHERACVVRTRTGALWFASLYQRKYPRGAGSRPNHARALMASKPNSGVAPISGVEGKTASHPPPSLARNLPELLARAFPRLRPPSLAPSLARARARTHACTRARTHARTHARTARLPRTDGTPTAHALAYAQVGGH